MAETLDRFARLSALRPAPRAALEDQRYLAEDSPSAGLDECTLATLLGATITKTKYGTHLSVRNWHATPEFCAPSAGVIELLQKTHASLRGSRQGERRHDKTLSSAEDPEKWLFLDTETTGLAGGTGTYAFLVGIAWWDAGGLQVEQFLMRDFSEEHSVLAQLAERLAERPVLVTFNGKSFDWPLLESRYVMTRSIRVPKLAAHLDLLHPARAVWRLRLGSVRLVELERHVLDAARLGWHREEDVPSSMIPQFYFDYLRGQSPLPLAAVVRHNRMDLRGLGALYGKLNSLLDSDGNREATEALDLFGLSRYLHRRGERGQAESACVAARDRGLPLIFDAQAKRDLAQMTKRRGQHEAAAALWEQLLQDFDCDAAACEELAIFHERRSKDFAKALSYAKQGLRELRKRQGDARRDPISTSELRRVERLEKRVARLELRLKSAGATRAAPLVRRGNGAAAGFAS